ncbi:hypothetical protein FJT64_006919 [Amphibalanus amphitrite]|uniref:Uncharacterized protein n=1 Tax=Amphibalanus amphitrite TaxID=1232801 RepID=A0A6A4VGK9_AMPAM|nr:hypothetical protein FJT64_006919 [Amphibalanus amphitrite]
MDEDGDTDRKPADVLVEEGARSDPSPVTRQPPALGAVASDPPRTSPLLFLRQPGVAAARELLQRCRAGRPLHRLRGALFFVLLCCCVAAGLLRGPPTWQPPPPPLAAPTEVLPITARRSGALLPPRVQFKPHKPRESMVMGFGGNL